MTILPQLKRDLEDAAGHALASPAPRRFRRPRPLVVLAVTVTLAVVAVVVVALASGSSGPSTIDRPADTGATSAPPNPGPIPADVDDAVITAASNSVTGKYPRCAGVNPDLDQLPAVDEGMPSQALLAALPALTDLPAPTRLANRGLFKGGPGLGRIYVRFVRPVRRIGPATYYLVPTADLGSPPLPAPIATSCEAMLTAALTARLPAAPAAERDATLRYGRATFARERYQLETSTTHEGVFLGRLTAAGGVAGGGLTAAQIERRGIIEPFTAREIGGVVPGGVARVRLVFPSRQFTGPVINDVFVIHLPKGMGRLQSTAWLSASGQTIRMVDERSSGA